MPALWDRWWGYLHKNNVAPVLVGEFGTKLADTSDTQWLTALTSYLGTGVNGISWTYWSWNPNSGDTGGILQDDWLTINQNKQNFLTPIEFALDGGGGITPTATNTPSRTPGGITNTPTRTPTSGPTSTPTRTPKPTTTPPTAASCQVSYTIVNQWTPGFQASLDIKNTGGAAINGWTLAWSFPNGQTITQLWNATYTQTGANVSATNLSWNANIASGATVNVGFNGTWSSSNAKPATFRLNGNSCSVTP
jgi:endoglucanase